jgi:hypothetical protein
MPFYCVNVNAQSSSGDHEVHDVASTQGCLPEVANRRDLGWHASCVGAVAAAKKIYTDVNGCFYCANPCHTT